MVAALVASHISGEPDNLIYHYQALIAGLPALASALWAGRLLRQQIDTARELNQLTKAIEDDRKQGQREAARTWLSLHLSAILNYAVT